MRLFKTNNSKSLHITHSHVRGVLGVTSLITIAGVAVFVAARPTTTFSQFAQEAAPISDLESPIEPGLTADEQTLGAVDVVTASDEAASDTASAPGAQNSSTYFELNVTTNNDVVTSETVDHETPRVSPELPQSGRFKYEHETDTTETTIRGDIDVDIDADSDSESSVNIRIRTGE